MDLDKGVFRFEDEFERVNLKKKKKVIVKLFGLMKIWCDSSRFKMKVCV